MVNVLSFAIGTYIDNVDGTFRINRTGVFIGITLTVFFFIYGINKFSSWLYTRDLKNYLRDLENSTLDNSVEVEKRKRRSKPFIIAAFIIFTLLLIYGIIRALNLFSAAS